ncbi:MAG: flagellar biosynthesis protein FlhF [Rhodoferax sp.]|uniref:flagellar biosynthesis protein FlhF n=1 Tax=Rhodoferax sp. TaxID=50421 RepID=UPI001400E910|nr:flagellar biosynthesis protein FlhF [Rhodoferax sp.]NDP39590.1 flagellar biosynthesis protein FlhF [Rhodoferax sp.]
MNIQRFNAPTAREALAKARHAFGEGTLILSNRPTATGVEVVATAEDTLAALDTSESFATRSKDQPMLRRAALASAPESSTAVEDDATQLAMSTLSFQDYVRERMLRRRHESLSGQTAAVAGQDAAPEPTPQAVARPSPRQVETIELQPPVKAVLAPKRAPVLAPAPAPALSQGIVSELHAMKALIEDRFNTLTWLGQARQSPIQSNLMLKLIRAGYSPTLSRTILERMPEEMGATESVRWVMDILERNLKTDAAARPIHEEGGTYALVGATGVGKTTTAAKLAGLCARTHGPASVGLITLDTYRVGAHEQLRAFGRMLGVVAHLAHDRAALQDLLNLLGNKKMVLIDTTGLAPNDPRKRGMLDVLDLPGVNRLLVLNAGGHGDSLDEVVSSFKSTGVQQAVLSKTDEAAKLGPALDAIIRHQLVLRGVTMGQKVPEDWEAADSAKLVRQSMRSPAKSAFDPKPADLDFFFTPASAAQAGRLDA